MNTEIDFDVIIIGGSYAGLSAAMALGRALCKVLVIDAGKPCNRQTPHSHNFLTRDGETPAALAGIATEQVTKYSTVKLVHDLVTDASKLSDGFKVRISSDQVYTAHKLLFATGITDQMPDIPGFAECWGITVVHCPYCHGYEIRHENTGILGNGEMGFELAKLICNWTDKLTLFTNGKAEFTAEQTEKLAAKQVKIVETGVKEITHENGRLKSIILDDDYHYPLTALYARLPFTQHCSLPQQLGCGLSEQGYIKVDGFGLTSVPGIFAVGDNTTPMRTVSTAVAAGTAAGIFISKEFISERF